jgi:hypothetical protein
MEYLHTNLKGASYADYLAAGGPEAEAELEKIIDSVYGKVPEKSVKPGKKELLAALCNDRLKERVAQR